VEYGLPVFSTCILEPPSTRARRREGIHGKDKKEGQGNEYGGNNKEMWRALAEKRSSEFRQGAGQEKGRSWSLVKPKLRL
jgi:hypothetical protein